MESSRRDLFIDMVVRRFIFKNNRITLSDSFTFIPETGVGLPKTGVSFYSKLPNREFTASNKMAYLQPENF